MLGSNHNSHRRRQSGYALLMVIFMVATIMIFAAMATPNLLTQGRREREAETVWRGEQYERAIGLYFRKFGRYPTKIDDLTKQTNGERFLRQAYKDPTNKEDGSWRFIYVGPNGALIGSVRKVSLLQGNTSGIPALGGASPLTAAGGGTQQPASGAPDTGNGSTAPGIGSGTAANTAPGATATGAGAPGAQTAQQMSGGLAPDSLASQPQPLSGAIIGGNIIGIGSKTKEDSLHVYEGGDTYDHWEFIWNPVQQIGVPGQIATPNASPNSTTPAGQPQQTPANPNPTTFTTPQFPGAPTTP